MPSSLILIEGKVPTYTSDNIGGDRMNPGIRMPKAISEIG